MKSNFSFLENDFPVLAKLGSAAENYIYTDADSCTYKLGKLGETVVNEIMYLDNLRSPEEHNSHATRIKLLKKEDLLPKDIDDILYVLRKARNKAVHTNEGQLQDCSVLLQMAFHLCVWFMQTYGDWNYEPSAYVQPIREVLDYKAIAEEKEKELQQLLELQESKKPSTPSIAKDDRVKQAYKAVAQLNKSEAETRYLIDEQLRKVGWEADSINLRYSKGTLPQKGRNIAIAEWPTNSNIQSGGRADYALFVDLQLVAIIEAKAEYLDIPSVIDYQCKEYPKEIRENGNYQISTWGEYKVPFTFATNGRPYLKQLETKSGIWFLDLRSPSNVPKALKGWISPQGMIDLLEKDIARANSALQETPYDLLRDENGLNLREYQIKAIEAAETAIINGQTYVLLSMATGTGKTRTILGMIYRFIKTNRFKRVLFLVDRTALGEQAEDVFHDVKIEELMTLDQIYDIKGLNEKEFEKETKIHIATVQSLVKRILYNEEDSIPSVTDYDLIIIDEAHRGYILDKELSDDELLYRDQKDYISKYRTVIEYFDAVKIALTATPALHTTDIFGKPVFNYSYREAVIEGFLVDHDAPHTIKTKLSEEGIQYQKGEIVAIYDPVTGEITNSDELEDELNFDIEQFNKRVITESFNRTVLKEIARDIDPEAAEQGKTLIYAVTDQHADLIVQILKEVYGQYDVDNDAIMKITGSIAGGNKKKIKDAIKCFKNEKYPSIVVTVDLLTTGIDVPEITNIVFMRCVKSRILFEQMMGRATRLCSAINKTHFEIYDPVRVYESLQDVSTMKPVSADPNATFEDLLNGLAILDSDKKIAYQIDLIIAKLQRKQRNMTDKDLEQFSDLSGGLNPDKYIEGILKADTSEAKDKLLEHRELFDFLNKSKQRTSYPVVISDKKDKLVSHTRGYGKGKKPNDYLDEFNSFVRENVNKVAALNIVCTRPKELTRETLKSLRLLLDREGFTEKQLNTAWNEMTNDDITADIISFVRRHAIGSTLLSHEERIQQAVKKLKKNHDFSRQELNWLDRIEQYLLNESVIQTDTFNEGQFRDFGGFKRINKIFQNKLGDIVTELNNYLYDDGGKTA